MELIKLNIPDEEQFDFQIAFVDEPAIESIFQAFNQDKNPFKFQSVDEKELIVMGYFMIADMKIPRYDEVRGRYNVVFPKDSVDKIVRNFSKNGISKNLNEMHNTGVLSEDCYVLSHFQIDSKKEIKAPKGFNTEADGSWFGIVRCENKEIYNKALNGDYTGFSIEGEFLEEQFKKIEMSKPEDKGILEKIKDLFKAEETPETTKEKFEELVLVDGETKIEIEPEVEVGAAIIIRDSEGTPVPAPIAEYELQDGRVLVVESEGIISEVKEKSGDEEVEEEMESEAPAKEQEKVKRIIESIVSEKVFASQEEIEELKKTVAFLKEENEALTAKFNEEKESNKETFAKLMEEPEKEPVVSKVKPVSFGKSNIFTNQIKTKTNE